MIGWLDRRLAPSDTLTPEQNAAGVRWWTRNGVGSQAMDTLTVGAFLTAFALELGASNVLIGLLAGIPYLTQLLQVPGIYLNDRWRNRRLASVLFTALSRPMYLVMAAAAFVTPTETALALFVTAFALRYVATAMMASSWHSWMRDLIPETSRGRLTSRRLLLMTAVGVVLGLGAALLVDWWKSAGHGSPLFVYSALFAGAFLGGAYGTWCMTRMPEPRMAAPPTQTGMLSRLASPFRDRNYRRLLVFVGVWNFSVNLAAPFFMVHMLKRLELDLTTIMVLTLISQVAHMAVLRSWGEIADRMSNKSVLQVCAPVFIGCVFAWTFTTFPDRHALTIPLLVVIHVLTGVATAGVNLATGNIAMKLAPRGDATVYLANNSLVTSAAAGIAPIVGGLLAHFFTVRELTLSLHWSAPAGDLAIDTLSISQWDFFFVLAAVCGLFALTRLARVQEHGEVEEQIVLNEVYLGARRFVQNLSSIAGLRQSTDFPFDPLERPPEAPPARDSTPPKPEG